MLKTKQDQAKPDYQNEGNIELARKEMLPFRINKIHKILFLEYQEISRFRVSIH